MSQIDPNRRFQAAYDKALAGWAAADPALAASRAGCASSPDGVVVPYFNREYVVGHPDGALTAHPSIAIVLIHYLLTADGAPVSDAWLTFRELPDGLFYAQAFAGHAEGMLAERFGQDSEGFRRAATALGGVPLPAAGSLGLAPPNVCVRFQAFPRLGIAVQLWEGDEDFPARCQVLFEAHAGHYLPTEDLSGVGDWLAHKLAHAG